MVCTKCRKWSRYNSNSLIAYAATNWSDMDYAQNAENYGAQISCRMEQYKLFVFACWQSRGILSIHCVSVRSSTAVM